MTTGLIRVNIILGVMIRGRMIISEAHWNLAQASSGRTLAEFKHRFWSIGVHRIVKRMIAQCPTSIRNLGKPSTSIMAALPSTRLQPNQPPFTRTVADYFGPLSYFQAK